VYTLAQFSTVTLPIYNPSGQFPTAPAQRTSLRVVGGTYDDSPTVARYEFPYTLNWQAVEAKDTAAAMRTAIDALRPLVATRSLLWRKGLDDGSYQYCEATLMSLYTETDVRAHLYQRINFEWLIHTHWYGGQIGTPWYLDAGEYLDTGLFLDVTDGSTTLSGDAATSISVTYNGNVVQTDVTCTITNGTGSDNITAITVAIGDTDLDWTGTLAAGKSLVIDGGAWSVLLDGADDYDDLSRGSSHALDTWFQLENGANTGTVTLTGGDNGSTNPTVTFEAFELYA